MGENGNDLFVIVKEEVIRKRSPLKREILSSPLPKKEKMT